ncbi:MAG: polyhydroxyalkanoic acid system family protein [Acidobacteria bacterium]|nr:polyhydroxyalkanoic acid system family protein [Acidobacteriota bacterium]
MRITIPHTKSTDEVKGSIDKGFDDIFKGLPVGPVQLEDEVRTWAENTLNFAFNAKTPFLTVPVKGWILVEAALVTIEVELPAFLKNFIPEEKISNAVEAGVKGLLA